jgi:hypothetical protein
MATLALNIQGIRCGNHGRARVYHLSATEVRECFQETQYNLEEAAREAAAERGLERHLEDRGYEEARAQEAHDAATGWWNLPVAASMWAADSRDLYR